MIKKKNCFGGDRSFRGKKKNKIPQSGMIFFSQLPRPGMPVTPAPRKGFCRWFGDTCLVQGNGWWLGTRRGGFWKGTHHRQPLPEINSSKSWHSHGLSRLRKLLKTFTDPFASVESRKRTTATGRALSKTSTIRTFRKLVQAYIKPRVEEKMPSVKTLG